MKRLICICCCAMVLMFSVQPAFGAGRIIKRVSNYVLIDTDQGVGGVGNVLMVYRDLFNETQRTGSVRIVRFKSGQTAAKIIEETVGLNIEVGDYVKVSEDEEDVIGSLFGESASTSGQTTRRTSVLKTYQSYDIIYGPLPGVTIIPQKGRVIAGAQAAFLSARSGYDANGNSYNFNEGVENVVDPVGTMNTLNIDFLYSFRKNACLGVSLPVVLTQKVDLNPLTNIGEEPAVIDGLTGIGDVRVIGRILLGKGASSRFVLDGGFRFATGSSIADVTEENVGPTGMGNTAIVLGVGADLFSDVSLIALNISYVINNEATYTSDDFSFKQKPGNQVLVDIRMGYKFSRTAIIGVEAQYNSMTESKVEGVTITGSQSNILSLAPIVGFRFKSSDSSISLFGGYNFPVSGKNNYRISGVIVGGLIYF